MTCRGFLANMTAEGATNADVLLTYLHRVFRPALRRGQTIMLNNLNVHKNQAVAKRVQTRVCRLIFLPRYSPDFSPIEGVFSKHRQDAQD